MSLIDLRSRMSLMNEIRKRRGKFLPMGFGYDWCIAISARRHRGRLIGDIGVGSRQSDTRAFDGVQSVLNDIKGVG